VVRLVVDHGTVQQDLRDVREQVRGDGELVVGAGADLRGLRDGPGRERGTQLTDGTNTNRG
jgi:hypothetical protein